MDHRSEEHKQGHSETFDTPIGSSSAIKISKYTQALIKVWEEKAKIASTGSNISVSQTVSFAAFLYEKMRNAVEFREEHLIRRATIERIIKRRMILNDNARDIAEPLIKELLWARYYENNSINEDKIEIVQAIIDKYFFLKNELCAGRSTKEQNKISDFFLSVLSCEIEESLSPDPKREAFTNYVYQILRPYLSPFDEGGESGRDVQVYIAVERTFSHSDIHLLRFHLLKLSLPEIKTISWRQADKVLENLYDVYTRIEKDIQNPLGDKIRSLLGEQIPPFLILRDVFEQNSGKLSEIITDDNKLKAKVDHACRARYDESRARLRRTGVRSFIYILLTKIIFAFIIEIPYDLYIEGKLAYLPITINALVPPSLMAGIIISVSIPGDDNTRRIYNLIKGIIDNDPDTLPMTNSGVNISKKIKSKSLIFNTIFSSLYLLTYLVSFGSIIFILILLRFSIVSQAIFIFFVTLITFFSYRVIRIPAEYQVITKENFLTHLADLFFLPIVRVGQWLSGEVLTRFNVLIYVLDFIIEMPFKAIVEVFDEWIRFVRIKKEEIV